MFFVNISGDIESKNFLRSRWICCLIVPIPQAAVQTHMQVLVVPRSMYAICQAYIDFPLLVLMVDGHS